MRHPETDKIYGILLKEYGPQGWWPLLSHKGTNPTKTGSVNGYHPGDHSFPKNEQQQFEICAGAVLTQNTGWPQVEKALANLMKEKLLDADKLAQTDLKKIKPLIRPAGYFNQKAQYLQNLSKFFIRLKSKKNETNKTPTRAEVLAVKGVGDETADSIMLYAFKQPEFVVDAYTKRIFRRLGMADEKASYHEMKEMFESQLEKDAGLFQEYHALIVEHAKRYCQKQPRCKGCPLSRICKKRL